MNNGYSLLELVVVISIVGIMLGVGAMSFSGVNSQRKVEKDIATFVDVLNTARQKTIDRDLGSTPDCATFEGYRVRVVASSSQVELYRMCGAVVVPVIATYSFSSAEILPATTFDIDFEPPYGTLKGAEQIVTIKNDRAGKCMDIRITTAGIISEESC